MTGENARGRIPLCLLFTVALFGAELTLEIDSTPRYYQPFLDTIYIAMNMAGWQPGAAELAFTESDGIWRLTLDIPAGTQLAYKFTRGDWTRGEMRSDGAPLGNRALLVQNDTIVSHQIEHWEDMVSGNHTVQGNVYHLDSNFPMESLSRTRRIWVYLPPNYEYSTNHYPVFYMHDGQNLFDAIYSFVGEWGIDESMQSLFQQGFPAIIVGIDNGGMDRIAEYTPWRNSQYGGGDGEAYLSFLVNELKPFIDSYFRTLPGRESTGLFGSSLGGYISFYGIMEYPEIFSMAGVFSPSFWFSDSLWNYMESIEKTANVRIYMLGGENESATMVPNLEKMAEYLENSGFSGDDFTVVSHSDGAHSEWYWRREFPAAFRWLNSSPPSAIREARNEEATEIRIFPNPFNPDTVIRFFLPENQQITLMIQDIRGHRVRLLHSGYATAGLQRYHWDGKNDFAEPVTSGIYLIILQSNEKRVTRKTVRLR